MENKTFLGIIYGVNIYAETKDEAKIKQIGKYLQEADDAYRELDAKFAIYCNEKEWVKTGKGFLFRCGPGCIHNPIN